MPFARLSILGVGLLGGSIGLAVRKLGKGVKIVGYGHRQVSLDLAKASKAIDEGTTDPLRAVDGADLVILCTPVGTFDTLLKQIAPALPRAPSSRTSAARSAAW
jgi:prephenate dehydrogenase